MEQWIPFEEGEYIVVDAYLSTPDGRAVRLENAWIEIYTSPKGERKLKGAGVIQPSHLVSLHEDDDDIDLILDLGGRYKYLLRNPDLYAGKVFAPNVNSQLQFYPSRPWTQITEEDYLEICERFTMLG